MPFKSRLNKLLDGVPGALGAIIIDWEGEAVDQAARIGEYDIKLLGAHKGIILNLLRQMLARIDGGELEELIIRTDRSKILLAPLNQEYFLVLSLGAESIAAQGTYQLRCCIEALRSEFQ